MGAPTGGAQIEIVASEDESQTQADGDATPLTRA